MNKNSLALLLLLPLTAFAENNFKGAEAFKSICFECHNLREFSMRTNMKRYYWVGKIKQMRDYTKISDNEVQLIADYLSQGTYMLDPILKKQKKKPGKSVPNK